MRCKKSTQRSICALSPTVFPLNGHRNTFSLTDSSRTLLFLTKKQNLFHHPRTWQPCQPPRMWWKNTLHVSRGQVTDPNMTSFWLSVVGRSPLEPCYHVMGRLRLLERPCVGVRPTAPAKDPGHLPVSTVMCEKVRHLPPPAPAFSLPSGGPVIMERSQSSPLP